MVLFDEWKLRYLRRDDEAYIPRPDHVKAVVATAMYGTRDEVEPAARRLLRIGRESGGTYLGDEISAGDWASRHDRYATPLHGRLRSGQVVPMSWHCEDASINYSQLPAVMEKWHAIAERYIDVITRIMILAKQRKKQVTRFNLPIVQLQTQHIDL